MLPVPRFSRENPYWSRPNYDFMRPEFRPRLTPQDFLYATVWETSSRDIHGASCVRLAMKASVWLGIEAAKAATKLRQETRNEKAVN